MSAAELKLHGVSIRRSVAGDDIAVPAYAVLTLLPVQGRGAMREVKLTRVELVTLIEEAAVTLRRIEEA